MSSLTNKVCALALGAASAAVAPSAIPALRTDRRVVSTIIPSVSSGRNELLSAPSLLRGELTADLSEYVWYSLDHPEYRSEHFASCPGPHDRGCDSAVRTRRYSADNGC